MKESSKQTRKASSHQSSTMPDWSTIPIELLETIATKLSTNFVDIIRFRAVCTWWRSIQTNPTSSLNPPWLLLSRSTLDFFNLSDAKTYSFPLPPAIFSPKFCGSSKGWVLKVESNFRIFLQNPITNNHFPLPPLLTLPGLTKPSLDLVKGYQENIIVKAVVSSSSTTMGLENSLSVMVIYGSLRVLAFCRNGDTDWKAIHIVMNDTLHRDYSDIEYFEGRFYAVTQYGRVVVFNLGVLPSAVEIRSPNSFKAEKNYLMESSGKLLLVSRYRGMSHDLSFVFRTICFNVFEWNQVDGKWVEVKRLGNRALFLGANHSLSMVASDGCGIKENCIYFTDNSSKDFRSVAVEHHDVGIYHMEDSHIETLPGYMYVAESMHQPPMWFATAPL